MASYRLALLEPLPYFAELPYYLWGQVNYDSEGDCKTPTDRAWTWLELKNRETRERLDVKRDGDHVVVAGDDPAAARAAWFLRARAGGAPTDAGDPAALGGWTDEDHARGLARAARVARELADPALAPFDSHLFWGSWKWVGWFATEFTWVGRWIMHAVARRDARAVGLCVDWLRAGTFSPAQSAALRAALTRLTGRSFDDDAGWIAWRDQAGIADPDLDAWYLELKAEYDPLMALDDA